MSKRNSVVKHVHDEYKFQHTRTETRVYTDNNNQRHTYENKQIRTATQESSSSSPRYAITNGNSGSGSRAVSNYSGNSGPRDRSTYTQTSKYTYRGPNNERYTHSDRNFQSSIQKSSYNPPQQVTYSTGYAAVCYDSD
ncbi:uncharacterized protein LOC135833501 [Planococcus citri]|uniref:uncharacterized protein LOC135833501 n=1 Tax=Planococcus citri TaxID=170843 RepID=UPI0031F8B9CB